MTRTRKPSKIEVIKMKKYREYRQCMDRCWEYMYECALKQMRGKPPKIEGGLRHFLIYDQNKKTE